MLPSILASGGLILLHKRRKGAAGIALLALGGGLSWLTGKAAPSNRRPADPAEQPAAARRKRA